MKKFLLKSSFFILLLVCIFGCVEYFSRKIPTALKYKNEWMSKPENTNDLEAIILGSSHTFHGVNPAVFPIKCFSLANISQSFPLDILLFDKYVDSLKSLKYVFISVDYFSFGSSLEAGEDSYLKDFYIGYEIKSKVLKQNFEFPYLSQNKENLISLFNKSEIHLTCDSFGYVVQDVDTISDVNFIKSANSGVERHTNNIPYDEYVKRSVNNKIILEKMAKKCDSTGIKFIMVTTPYHQEYIKNLTGESYRRIKIKESFCDSLVKVYKNVEYYNLFDDKRFKREEFYDPDHLNKLGSLRFTKILCDTLGLR